MAKLTNENKREIISLTRDGCKVVDIAKRFGVEPKAIRYVKDQYIIHGEILFNKDKKLKSENSDKIKIKKMQAIIDEQNLIIEHQKKFQVFVEEANKKKNT